MNNLKFKVREWKLLDLYKRRYQINFPVFERGNVWSEEKKALLIDSILRGIDIPKLYLQKTREEPNEEWDCIDGRQRIGAIVGFFDEEFRYAGRKFSQLIDEEQKKIEEYLLTITEVKEIDDDEVRLLFIRLQLGVPLNSGEKLNAIRSNLGDFVKQMAKKEFIAKLSIPSRRFAKEQVCAQICNNSRFLNKTGEFRNSKYEDLANLYRVYIEFDPNSEAARGILSVLDRLYQIFSNETTEIRNRASAVSIYLLVEEMMLNNKLQGREDKLKRFYVEFLKATQEEVGLGMDAKNRFLVSYQSKVIQAADSKSSISERDERLRQAFDYYQRNNKIIGFD